MVHRIPEADRVDQDGKGNIGPAQLGAQAFEAAGAKARQIDVRLLERTQPPLPDLVSRCPNSRTCAMLATLLTLKVPLL